ncbi:Exostosin-1, partial [Rhizophlyctis rosea]
MDELVVLSTFANPKTISGFQIWEYSASAPQLRISQPTNVPPVPSAPKLNSSQCHMWNCFDYSRCSNLTVYVYPYNPSDSSISPKYLSILNAISSSPYITTDPTQACILIPNVDTLDRDVRSNRYLRNANERLQALPHWNGGLNHLVWVLYSGTYPHYDEEVDLDLGKAILAKASMGVDTYRTGFDISLPLFLKEDEAAASGKAAQDEDWPGAYISDPALLAIRETKWAEAANTTKSLLVGFKGTHYWAGKGSEVRSALHLYHNGNDSIIVTNCPPHLRKHSRCKADTALFDSYDYDSVLTTSTFSLCPRGRRLGSYRFLESLRAGSIPVLLGDGYIPPFGEWIDWTKAAVTIPESRLDMMLPTLRSFSTKQTYAMRRQTRFFYEMYFSSNAQIARTTLEVLRSRLFPRPEVMAEWNRYPGIHHLPADSSPFLRDRKQPRGYTAVITSSTRTVDNLRTLLPAIGIAKGLRAVFILLLDAVASPLPTFQHLSVPLYITTAHNDLNNRFYPFDQLEGDAILSLNDTVSLTKKDIELAYSVWLHNQNRLVGFEGAAHIWDETGRKWVYRDRDLEGWTSMVLTNAVMFHRDYAEMYTKVMPDSIRDVVDLHAYEGCQDIAMNFLVAHANGGKEPIVLNNSRIST